MTDGRPLNIHIACRQQSACGVATPVEPVETQERIYESKQAVSKQAVSKQGVSSQSSAVGLP